MIGRNVAFIVILVAVAMAATLALGPVGTSPAQGQAAAKYLGAQKCMMCHQDEHKSWMEMKHSKAFEVLKPEDLAGRKDEKTGKECVACHTTGYGKGGFTTAEATPALKGVGCETCHGAGSIHMMGMMQAAMLEGADKEAAEKTAKAAVSRDFDCAGCHNPHINFKKLYGK